MRQIKFDFKRIVFQKKYIWMLIGLLLLSLFFAFLSIFKREAGLDVIKLNLIQFRPFYWLISCYLICDLITVDYHHNTIKTILPYSSSRKTYLLSKVLVSTIIGYSVLFIYLIGTMLVATFFSPSIDYSELVIFFLLSSLGTLETLFLFASLFLLIITLTKNEAVTIGFGLGLVFILLILESIQWIASYLPTMQMLQLPLSNKLDIATVLVLIFISVIFLTVTLKVFRQKDLFV